MTLPMLPAWIPLALVPIVSSDPNSTFSVVFSLIPYSAPVLMSARIAATAVPSWQIALCFFLILFTAAASWVACTPKFTMFRDLDVRQTSHHPRSSTLGSLRLIFLRRPHIQSL